MKLEKLEMHMKSLLSAGIAAFALALVGTGAQAAPTGGLLAALDRDADRAGQIETVWYGHDYGYRRGSYDRDFYRRGYGRGFYDRDFYRRRFYGRGLYGRDFHRHRYFGRDFYGRGYGRGYRSR